RLNATLRHKAAGFTVMTLVQRALAESGATAWVCENDSLALLCLQCLHNLTPTPSPPPALVGFDNTLSAVQQHLTSYDFDSDAAAAAMLHHLLNWHRHPQAAASDRPTTIPGFLCSRRSTATRLHVCDIGDAEC
ncbi:MAG: hypothetical protein GF331_01640, partial [Chitinivibrionales bacterium]|nr:hypothetical protein [Chitinivibrionales bacterium]